MDKQEKNDWFDRMWAAYHNAVKTEVGLQDLNVATLRRVFQLSYATRPADQPDEPEGADRFDDLREFINTMQPPK